MFRSCYLNNIGHHLVPPLGDVHLAGPLCVDRVPLVWVDHHTAATIIVKS